MLHLQHQKKKKKSDQLYVAQVTLLCLLASSFFMKLTTNGQTLFKMGFASFTIFCVPMINVDTKILMRINDIQMLK